MVAIVEHVEHESYNPVSLNQPHTTHVRLGGFVTVMADTTLFKNEVIVHYDFNPTDDEVEDDDVESNGSDSEESSVKEDIPPHEAPLVPEFKLVDASDDDEAVSHGALPEHPFFGGNEELRKEMIIGSKEQVQHTVKQYAICTHHPFKAVESDRVK